MLMPPFELHHPSSVEEAISMASSLVAKGEAFDWVAGGPMCCRTTNGASIQNLT